MSTTLTSGVGLAFDSTAVIDAMVSAEKVPKVAIQNKQAATQNQISLLGGIISQLQSFGTLAKGMATVAGAQAYAAKSSNEGSVSASVSGAVRAGAYKVNVTQIATAQTSASTQLDSDTAGIAGSGTLTLQAGSGSPINVDYDATDSLSTIAAKINAQAGGIASASVLYDGSKYRLVVDSKQTGSAGAIAFSDSGSSLAMGTQVAAQDAKLTVNGLDVTRSSNSVSDVIPGLTLALNDVSAGPVTLSVTGDNSATASKLSALIDAYNSVVRNVNSQTTYSGAKLGPETLFGDRSVVALRQNLGSVLSTSYTANGATTSVGMIGIKLNSDGTLTLDQDKLTAALQKDPKAVQNLFVGDRNNGLAKSLNDLVDRFAGTSGVLTLAKTNRNDNLGKLAAQIAKIEDRAELMRTQWTSQFAKLDALTQTYKSQQSYLTQLANAANNNR